MSDGSHLRLQTQYEKHVRGAQVRTFSILSSTTVLGLRSNWSNVAVFFQILLSSVMSHRSVKWDTPDSVCTGDEMMLISGWHGCSLIV